MQSSLLILRSRLSLLDSSAPQSPTLNLPRVLSPPPMSAKTTSPGRPSSPSDFHGTPTRRSSAPREPDASSESVFGQHDTWLESASGTFGTSSVSELGNGSDRSRRGLSIIDEGDITLNGKKNNQNEGSDDGDDDGDGDEASVKAVKNSLGGKIDGRPIKAANGSS